MSAQYPAGHWDEGALPDYLISTFGRLSAAGRRNVLPGVPEQLAGQMLDSARLQFRLCARVLKKLDLSPRSVAVPANLEVPLLFVLGSAPTDIATDLGLAWNGEAVSHLLVEGRAGSLIEDHGRARIVAALALRLDVASLETSYAGSDRPLIRANIDADGRACLHAWISRLPRPVRDLIELIAPDLIEAASNADTAPLSQTAMADMTRAWIAASLAAAARKVDDDARVQR